ncbi:uncharacterized protein E0L32_000930 [Thyridium curvatum]|uniref:Uncharacterized protein n=1 Tax=Thyridium curvatum TaxID=1093900 RepID=A0A507AYP6_9PEZI|nr:uncharacterized protein E0L32_000930 [Thyridium curvatum]TPX12753.1 hypothetical protein E0L32_000930 [Thyridium curvatum]
MASGMYIDNVRSKATFANYLASRARAGRRRSDASNARRGTSGSRWSASELQKYQLLRKSQHPPALEPKKFEIPPKLRAAMKNPTRDRDGKRRSQRQLYRNNALSIFWGALFRMTPDPKLASPRPHRACTEHTPSYSEPPPSPTSSESSQGSDYVDEDVVRSIAARTLEDETLYLAQSFVHVVLNELQAHGATRLVEIDVAKRTYSVTGRRVAIVEAKHTVALRANTPSLTDECVGQMLAEALGSRLTADEPEVEDILAIHIAQTHIAFIQFHIPNDYVEAIRSSEELDKTRDEHFIEMYATPFLDLDSDRGRRQVVSGRAGGGAPVPRASGDGDDDGGGGSGGGGMAVEVHGSGGGGMAVEVHGSGGGGMVAEVAAW